MMKMLALLILASAALLPSACATSAATKQTFYNNLVACTKADPQNKNIESAAVSCVQTAATGSLVGCVSAAVPALVWTADEIDCIASNYVK